MNQLVLSLQYQTLSNKNNLCLFNKLIIPKKLITRTKMNQNRHLVRKTIRTHKRIKDNFQSRLKKKIQMSQWFSGKQFTKKKSLQILGNTSQKIKIICSISKHWLSITVSKVLWLKSQSRPKLMLQKFLLLMLMFSA